MKPKIVKRTIVIILSCILAVSIIACGKQEEKENISVWNSYEWEEVGGFTMEGNNLSPIKEIGVDCNTVSLRIDDYSSEEPVILHVRLEYDETNRIIADKLVVPAIQIGGNIIIAGHVKKGDHIRVFTQVFNENGDYNPDLECTLSYSYMLVK